MFTQHIKYKSSIRLVAKYMFLYFNIEIGVSIFEYRLVFLYLDIDWFLYCFEIFFRGYFFIKSVKRLKQAL